MKLTQASGKMIFLMEKASTTTLQVMSTRVISKKEGIMEWVLMSFRMGVSTLVNGITTKCKERALLLIRTQRSGRETLLMACFGRLIKGS